MTAALLLLLACSGGDDDAKGDDTGGASSTTDSAPPAPVAPDLKPYSGGTCPELVEGANSDFASAGESREFQLKLPEDPVGAPVVFLWHWLGGTASQALQTFRYGQLPEDEGVIVVAPSSCCDPFEWQFMTPPEENVDLVFFDDLLTCLDEQFSVDRDRIWATGMSAGGLWTTYLTVERAGWLVATAPFSGGTDPVVAYRTPDEPIPVMLTWGGPTDIYAVLSFEEASLAFESSLMTDGHFVVECLHDGGHTIPTGGPAAAWEFFEAHPRGVAPEPWADGLPDGFLDICHLPETSGN